MMKQFKSFVCWLIVAAYILSLIDKFAISFNWMIWSFPVAGILQIAVHFALKYYIKRHPYNPYEIRRIKGKHTERSEGIIEMRHNAVLNTLDNQRKLCSISEKPISKTKGKEETVLELQLKEFNPEMSDQVEQFSFDPSTEENIKESLQFDFILTDETTRSRILDYIKPKYADSMSYQNLNLAYGAIDKNRKIFLTLSYYASQYVKRCDDNLDDYEFVVLTDKSEFKALCQMNNEIIPSSIRVTQGFEQYLEAVSQAIAFYMNYKEREALENQLKSLNPEFKLYKLQRQLIDEIIDNIKGSAPINSIQDAKELFLEVKCNGKAVRSNYSNQTVQNYLKYVDEQTEFEWRSEEYIRLLTEIKDRNATRYSKNLTTAKWLCEQGVSDNNEKLYVEAWVTLFCDNKVEENDFNILNGFIIMYQNKFADRVDKLRPVLEIADEYIKKNFTKYYKNTSGYSTIQVYNMNAKILYEKISSGTSFKEDILSFRGGPDEEERKKLQKICDVLNGRGIVHLVTLGYTVERFKLQSEYRPEERRFVNKEGDIWLYFMGCTDGTHAPAGFRESEWFMFYYKGFAAELHFEEQFTAPRTFNLKIAFVKGYHIAEISELNTILHEKGILVEKYYQLLREALDASRPNSSNYYVF